MSDDHGEIMDRYISNLDVIAQRSVMYSASRVPPLTRKYSGQAQASTRIGIGSPDPAVTLAPAYLPNAIPDSISRAITRIQARSKGIRIGDVVYVSNNLEYILTLEYIFGDLMFTKAAAMWEQDVERAVNDTK